MRRASALIMALWTIAVLSIMVLSFATEAHLYSGINVYVRERNRVGRLLEPGRMLAEIVLTGFQDAKEWSDGEDLNELLEDDRWLLEKRELKTSSKCSIGPLLVDDAKDKEGNLLNPSTVKVDIELVNAGDRNAINVNELYKGGDAQYQLRWELILRNYCGVPEDFEVRATDAHYKGESKVKLTDLLIASWNDWRDEDDVATAGEEGDECGAESEWYREYYEDKKTDDEDKKFPRNGAIADIKELGFIRGFRDFPAILTGGTINSDGTQDDKSSKKSKSRKADPDETITVRGLVDLLGTSGDAKVNVNNCTVDQLLTVPGIASEDEDDDEDSRLTAEAIVAALKVPPEYRDDYDESRDWWPYKDWTDLVQRVEDFDSNAEIGNEAQQYLTFVPGSESVFKVTITGQSMGMTKVVRAEGYVKDKKVRYVKWRED